MINTPSHETLSRAQAIQQQLITWRRTLHQQPELGFQEYKTAHYVAQELRPFESRLTAVAIGSKPTAQRKKPAERACHVEAVASNAAFRHTATFDLR